MSGARGRERSPLFGGANDRQGGLSAVGTDPESLERNNDAQIAQLEDRVGMLKDITSGIHGEVGRHNRVLDGVDGAFNVSRAQLGGTVDRFSRVMVSQVKSKPLVTVGIMVAALWVLYYVVFKR
ncbi:unnamed protein product [Pedinophyceae sp. YPF-701]|nr:unnamed protein product [Pedinophyceae sp. YPF-701]